jgi:hypothetical protein
MLGAIVVSGIKQGEVISLTPAPALLVVMAFLLWTGPVATHPMTTSASPASRRHEPLTRTREAEPHAATGESATGARPTAAVCQRRSVLTPH